jgi:pimeloyl-ACP methyl ester carboxylesterase
MSAGGQFNYEFAAWKPDRVAAFVVNKGGIYYTAKGTPWVAMFRFYGPDKPIFDKTWRLPDIERAQ